MSLLAENDSGRNFRNFQNRIRGAVGSVRSRKFEKFQKDKALQDSLRINRVLTEARKFLNEQAYERFLAWANLHVKTYAPSIEQSKYRYEELGSYSRKPPLDIMAEISATCSRLALNSEIISEFRLFADGVEEAYWRDDTTALQRHLDDVESAFGQSLWLIEAHIALKQAFEGLESQKRYTQQIRTKARNGIGAYIAHFLSVKNEPTVTHSRFAENIERRLQRSKLPNSAKIYLNLRLADKWPTTLAGIASILQVAQTTSICDLYETFIKVAQRLVASGSDSSVQDALRAGLIRLRALDDFRVVKLLILLDRRYDPGKRLPSTDYLASDLLLSGKPSKSLLCAVRTARAGRINVNSILAAAFCLAGSNLRSSEGSNLRGFINRFASLFSKAEDFDRLANETLRLANNLWFLPSMKALRQVAELECFPKDASGPMALRTKFLNGRELDARDLVNGLDIVEQDVLEKVLTDKDGLTAAVIGIVGDRDLDTSSSNLEKLEASLDANIFAALVGYIKVASQSKHESGVEDLNALAINEAIPRPLRIRLSLRLINIWISQGNVDVAVDLMAHEFVVEPLVTRVLPVAELIGVDGWKSLRPFSEKIAVPIVLDLRWRDTNDDRIATYRRFATQQFLLRNGLNRPSEMAPIVDQFPRAELIYFLNEVCTYSVLDMLPVFSGSAELQDERRKICEILVEIDQGNARRYQAEILEIVNRVIVQSGLQIVDSSRVHVELDAIIRWAKRELEESFFRYKALVKVGLGTSDNFDDVLRRLLKNESEDIFLTLPNNEADELLVGIVELVKQQFLFDTSFGLDSYLSQRIRHGSLMNYLRSPVEQTHLVTQKDAAKGNYQRNVHWLEKLQPLGNEAETITKLFQQFSHDFDGIVLELKDKYLNVASKEKPDGLMFIDLPSASFYLLRSVMPQVESIEELVRTCVALFWLTLDPSLKSTQTFLNDTVKMRFSVVFDHLRVGVFAATKNQSAAFADLSFAIGSASSSVQSELDKISGWLDRQELRESKNFYTLKQAFEIAVESLLSAHKTFEPVIIIDVTSEVTVSAGEMITLADIMRVALGNVDAHSGMKQPPKVWISSRINETDETLTVRIESEVGRGVRTPERELEMEKIRTKIADGTFVQDLRKQGGTGFKRLANLAHQSSKGKLTFGFETEELFAVEIVLSFVTVNN